ncbi:NAD(P)-dependent oxidoreductase [Roseiarcaceae bacterium H3SJ34-1]|uniref:NAD-dependent epimerase/dehydratase family protein n=1 Tax=Terripilifer ovatus TaxID=3032367 RepID=UPI003AB93191|nr:NAD(P)-dependent oxidoreductase [Roseiarcaceae bacterium H3SJ34-1]
MRILVSGATGVIGRRVIPLLLAQGHTVTALTRHSLTHQLPAGAQLAVADLFDPDALNRAVAGHDVLINLATHMPSSSVKMMFRSAWRLNDRIRSEGVANLVAAARNGGVTTFIQESFAPAYPDQADRWIGEQTPLAPAGYNATLLDAERSVATFSTGDRTGVILRFAAFYGPDAMQVHAYIDGLRRGWALLPGGSKRFISSVSHDDAAAAVVAALKAPAGAYNVGDDEPVRRAVYFGSLAAALGVGQPRFLPGWTAPLLGTVGPTMARSLRLSNRKLKEATGWTPKFPSVREGWRSLIEMQCSPK